MTVKWNISSSLRPTILVKIIASHSGPKAEKNGDIAAGFLFPLHLALVTRWLTLSINNLRLTSILIKKD